LREQIWQKARWIILSVFVNIIVIVGAGMMLKEFPQRYDGGFQYVILRYDDYRLFKDCDYRPYKDYIESTSHEEDFIKFMLTNSIRMSIASVPIAISNKEMQNNEVLPSRIQLLTEGVRKNLFEICLHGYRHMNNSVKWSPSEFSGIPLLTQETMVKNGKHTLESLTGTKVKVFVPPFNGWDQNTLMALADNGFSILSAEAIDFPRINYINYFPYTATPMELQYLIATDSIGANKLIVVNIHPHDLLEDKKRIGIGALEKLINTLKNSLKVELISFEEAVAKKIVFSNEELLEFSNLLSQIRFWENLPLNSYLIRTKSVCANRPYYSGLMLDLLKAFMGINLFIIGVLVSQIMGNIISQRIVFWAVVFCLVFFIAFILWKAFDYWCFGEVIAGKRFCLIFLTFGMLIGFIPKMLNVRGMKFF
jgi:predicted deacetylase